jgi:hypothetical protein
MGTVGATGSITSSMRDPYDNRWHGTAIGPDDNVTTPTAMAVVGAGSQPHPARFPRRAPARLVRPDHDEIDAAPRHPRDSDVIRRRDSVDRRR